MRNIISLLIFTSLTNNAQFMEILTMELGIANQYTSDWHVMKSDTGQINLIAKHRKDLSIKIICTTKFESENELGDVLILEFTSPSLPWKQRNEPKNMVQCDEPPAVQNSSQFLSRTTVFRFHPNVTSAVEKLTCKVSNKTHVKSEVFAIVFVPGEKALIHSGQNITYKASDEWIPCPTTDPRIPVSLFLDNEQNGIEQQYNVTYEAYKGFYMKRNREHIFICSTGSDDKVRLIPEHLLPNSSTGITLDIFHRFSFLASRYRRPLIHSWKFENRSMVDDWEIVHSFDGMINIIPKTDNVSKDNLLVLSVLCVAPYEIVWIDIKRHHPSYDVSECDYFPERNNGTLYYLRYLLIRFHQSPEETVGISCSPKEVYRPYRQANLFSYFPRKGKNLLVYNGQTKTYYVGIPMIQCPSTDPRTNVTLWFENSETGIITPAPNIVGYNPAAGFISSKALLSGGIYICKAGIESVRFEEKTFFAQHFNFPRVEIASNCNKEDTALILYGYISNVGDYERKNNKTQFGERIWMDFTKSFFPKTIDIYGYEKNFVPPLQIFCVKNDIGFQKGVKSGRLTRKWKISRAKDSSIEVAEHYLVEKSFVFYRNGTGMSSSRLNWDYFPYDEYIFMISEGETTYHTNSTSRFICKTGRKISENLTFLIERLGGNVAPILQELGEIKVKHRPHLLFRSWILQVQLPIDAVAIKCKIPTSVHPTLYLGAERRFKTKNFQVPKIRNEKSTYSFQVGQYNQRISCFAEGEPWPIYNWKKNSQDLDLFNDTQTATGKHGESMLIFETVTKSQAGNYVCRATNKVGSCTFIFTVVVEDDPKQIEDRIGRIKTGVFGFAIVLFAFCIFGFGIYRFYAVKISTRELTANEMADFFNGSNDKETCEKTSLKGNFNSLPYNDALEINVTETVLDYGTVLGKGEYGVVLKAFIKSSGMHVAVKIPKGNSDVTLFKSVLSEIKILSFIGNHVHVVSLVGANTSDIKNRNVFIFLDLCELGSLEIYLRKNQNNFLNQIDESQQINAQATDGKGMITTVDLIRWSTEIATGMEYLSYRSVVHADLGARNVLLTKEGTVKITDFGMSMQSNLASKPKKGTFPWRWMALESLRTFKFSAESDVWSYGVTLWEIFSLGDVPFPNKEWDGAFVNMLLSGIRLGKPKFSNLEIYSKIGECWDEEPAKRPTFTTLRKYFSSLHEILLPSVNYENPTGDGMSGQCLKDLEIPDTHLEKP